MVLLGQEVKLRSHPGPAQRRGEDLRTGRRRFCILEPMDQQKWGSAPMYVAERSGLGPAQAVRSKDRAHEGSNTHISVAGIEVIAGPSDPDDAVDNSRV